MTRTAAVDEQQFVDQWNIHHPVGTRVVYWPVRGEHRKLVTHTRTEAWLLGGHTPVVCIAGISGGVALSHLDIADKATPPTWLEPLTRRLPPGAKVTFEDAPGVGRYTVTWWTAVDCQWQAEGDIRSDTGPATVTTPAGAIVQVHGDMRTQVSRLIEVLDQRHALPMAGAR